MADERTWTAEELLALTPEERDLVIRAAIVTDSDQIPTELTRRARAKADAHIAANAGNPTTR